MFDELIREGSVESYSLLARLAGVSRARITQIMNLTLLAPNIVKEILFFPGDASRRVPMKERHALSLANESNWHDQRKRRRTPHEAELRLK